MAKLRAEADSAVVSQSASLTKHANCHYCSLSARILLFAPLVPVVSAFRRRFWHRLSGLASPPSTEVASSPWIAMRDPDMYGQHSNNCRPERWPEVSREQRRQWNIYDFHWGLWESLVRG